VSEPFSREERDRCVERVRAAEAEAYQRYDPAHPRSPLMISRAEDAYLAVLGEYADRLPRVVMSACPFTGAELRRAWDPFGTDGPWWHATRAFEPVEPAPPAAFRALLGAVDFRGREPVEATHSVLAGPGAPFVVPRLLELPDMVAVMYRIELATGDVAYPTGYFSREALEPSDLHQFWTRQDLWFKTEEGQPAWTMANDPWDFDLEPWIVRGKLRWIRPDDPKHAVVGHEKREKCPYVGLEGPQLMQVLDKGKVSLEDAPDGVPPAPFEDDEGAEQEDER
jgi:hypothetical protein